MRIFHIATAADWERARTCGAYTTSTLGRTLEDEGFLHAARADQVAGVLERYYGDVRQPLVLLTIDTDLLCRCRGARTPSATETFPHIYGALSPSAVVEVEPVDEAQSPVATGRAGSSTHSLHEPG